jgi:phage tail tape-measure protein
MKRIESLVIALMEEVVAEKVVNKFVTEMGTDMKKLFENATIRDDIRFYMRKNVEKMIDAIKERGE